MTVPRGLVERLREAKRVLLLSHLNPDFDTAASTLAMMLALQKMGKEVVAYNGDGLPPNMGFLPGSEQMVSKLHPRKRFDTTVTLDASSPDRFGEHLFNGDSRERLGTILKVDHHLNGDSFGDHDYVDSNRASTGELVVDVLHAYPVEIDYDIALNLYVAIVSDTGGFRYSNTNSDSFRCAGEMLEHGVNPWDVTTKLFESRPLAELKLLSLALDTLNVSDCGQYATLFISREMFDKSGAQEWMTDGFINYARAIDGVEVAVLIRDTKTPGTLKASFRSKGSVNVAAIAKSLGGGGHHNAAGCSIKGDFATVQAKLKKKIEAKLPKPCKNGSKSKKA